MRFLLALARFGKLEQTARFYEEEIRNKMYMDYFLALDALRKADLISEWDWKFGVQKLPLRFIRIHLLGRNLISLKPQEEWILKGGNV